MIQTPTVFILGAGASVDYGMPLGNVLVEQIISALDTDGVIRRSINLMSGPSTDIDEFRRVLAATHSDSIDTFLEGSSDREVEIGKAAVAMTILAGEKTCCVKNYLDYPAPGEGWYRYFWQELRAGCTREKPESLAGNRVSIITYNYDRSLEAYLTARVRATFGLDASTAAAVLKEAIEIVHVHGMIEGRAFGDLPEHASGDVAKQLAESIRVVHEGRHDTQYALAHRLIREAQRVCFLGFGYHESNVRSLQTHELLAQGADIYASAYGMGDAQIFTAQHRLNLGRGTWGKPEWQARKFLREVVPLM